MDSFNQTERRFSTLKVLSPCHPFDVKPLCWSILTNNQSRWLFWYRMQCFSPERAFYNSSCIVAAIMFSQYLLNSSQCYISTFQYLDHSLTFWSLCGLINTFPIHVDEVTLINYIWLLTAGCSVWLIKVQTCRFRLSFYVCVSSLILCDCLMEFRQMVRCLVARFDGILSLITCRTKRYKLHTHACMYVLHTYLNHCFVVLN